MKHCWLTFLLVLFSSLVNSQNLDSIFNLTKPTNHDTIRASAYVELSLLLYEENIDTLFSLNKQAKDICNTNLSRKISKKESQSFERILSEAYNNIGYYYQVQSEFDKAIRYYLKCIELDKKNKNLDGLSINANNIGMIYNYKGEIEKSLKFFLLSLKFDEYLKNDESIGMSLNNIAYIYEHQGDTTNALNFYNRALENFKHNSKKTELAGAFINVGSILRKQGKNESAIDYFNNSLNIYTETNNELGMATSFLNLGNIYFEINRVDSSKIYLEKSLQLYQKNNNIGGVSIASINLGKIALQNNNLILAKELGETALSIAKKHAIVYNVMNAAQLLSQVYQKQQNFRESLKMYQLHITMRDSLNNKATQRTTTQQTMQHEFDKKELINKVEHEKKLALSISEKKNKNLIIIAISIVLLLIIIFSIITVKRLKISTIQKQLIEEKNNENTLLLSEIHHRVKNNLQVISSLLGLQERSINDPKVKAAIIEGKERVKSMGLIHKMLYQNDNYSGVDMNDYVTKLVHGLLDSFGIDEKNIELNISISNLKLDVDTAIPVGLIINELVINALKHAYDKTTQNQLMVSLNEENNQLILQISDNGKGKISDIENTDSFGMKLVKSITRQVNGVIEWSDESGLEITINIKNYKLAK